MPSPEGTKGKQMANRFCLEIALPTETVSLGILTTWKHLRETPRDLAAKFRPKRKMDPQKALPIVQNHQIQSFESQSHPNYELPNGRLGLLVPNLYIFDAVDHFVRQVLNF